MIESLKNQHNTMVEAYVSKALITLKLPYVSQPVSIYIETDRLQTVLTELLDQQGVIVYDKITIPHFVDYEIMMLEYSREDILNGKFKIPKD